MKSYLFGAVSALSLIAAGSASANEDDGWYLRGNAGYGIHHDAELTGGIDSSLHGNGIQSEGNIGYSAGVGYDFGDNWRLELDADSLKTSFGAISQTPNSSGKLRTETLMLNALYDFDGFGKFEPYVGAGLGLVRGKGEFSATDFAGTANELVINPTCIGTRTTSAGLTCGISNSDNGFGWQLLAGLGYKISDNLTWDTHYTYLNGPDLDLQGHVANVNTGAFENFDAELSDVGAHTLMTGLRYKFGQTQSKPKPIPPAPVPTFECWDGAMVFNSGQCAVKPEPVVEAMPEPTPMQTCWDGSIIAASAVCPSQPAPQPTTYSCWDGSVTYDLATCPVQQPVVQQANLNLCSESSVAIFNVPANKTPKQMPRLGTMPEFGDSHGLTPSQFYDKLNARYNDNATDKAYLNYLFKSMGYSNGWSDAQAYMFSEEVLPVGTRGLLGLGKQHHYEYSILPTNDRDRQAFRIQSANGSVVHFMKTCGNYMYACE
ncbi:MAG: outer membrane protein [Litorimonas sp.]